MWHCLPSCKTGNPKTLSSQQTSLHLQKRFRARQRERARDSAAQMEALSAQMGRLMQEKAELETRNRILEQVVKLNVDHVEQLQSHKVRSCYMQFVFGSLHADCWGLYPQVRICLLMGQVETAGRHPQACKLRLVSLCCKACRTTVVILQRAQDVCLPDRSLESAVVLFLIEGCVF